MYSSPESGENQISHISTTSFVNQKGGKSLLMLNYRNRFMYIAIINSISREFKSYNIFYLVRDR
jgi:hypothetical protein